MNEDKVIRFADKLVSASLKEISIRRIKITIKRGHDRSINNQQGGLRESNYFGKDLEFLLAGDSLKIPITMQLYLDISNHYRIFVYNQKGMLTSVNLTTGYNDGEVSLKIQMKLSNTNLTKEEREKNRDMILSDVESEGIEIIPKNTVYFGKYDMINEKFIDTTAERFLEQLVKVALIKGHYMENKGYKLSML